MTEHVLAVQRMQDYINAHLSESITLGDLARASLFSPWHAHRLFLKETGLTPAEYIRRLRLSRSAMKLKDGCRVTDAACDLGFGSVDGYQRAFLREFGMNPGAYARSPQPLPLFIPYGVIGRALRKEPMQMEQVQSVFIQVIHKPERKIIVKRGVKATDYFSYCEEVGCDVWGLLMSMDSLCGEPVCLWKQGQYYMQGVERDVNDASPIPEGLEAVILPESDYLMFQGEPFAEENYREAIGALMEGMQRYNPSILGYQWDDARPDIQLEPRGERGYIHLRPVKRV